MLGGIDELLSDDTDDDSGGDGDTADGPAPYGEDTELTFTQIERLYSQAAAVLGVLKEERVRDLVIVEHNKVAFIAIEEAHDARTSAQINAAEKVAHDATNEASLVRLGNPLR